jgi:hypothetical protein
MRQNLMKAGIWLFLLAFLVSVAGVAIVTVTH